MLLSRGSDQNGGNMDEGKVLCCSSSFTNSPIKLVRWASEERLWICDENGGVFLIDRIQSLSAFLIGRSPTPVLKLDCSINQIDCFKDLLVISTETQSVIYCLRDGLVKPIGAKPRSPGKFGITFLPFQCDRDDCYSEPEIFVARPKARIWRAKMNGFVELTHQLNDQILKTYPQPIYNLSKDLICPSNNPKQSSYHKRKSSSNESIPQYRAARMRNFSRLEFISFNHSAKHLILALSDIPSTLYIINPISGKLVLWTNQLPEILGMECHIIGEDIFILSPPRKHDPSSCPRIVQLTIMKPRPLFHQLMKEKSTEAASTLLTNHKDYFQRAIFRDPSLIPLIESLQNDHKIDIDFNFDFIENILNQTHLVVPDAEAKLHPSNSTQVSSIVNDHLEGFDLEQNWSHLDWIHKKSLSFNLPPTIITDCVKPSQTSSHLISDSSFDSDSSKYLSTFKCDCGYPRPGSHKNFSLEKDVARELLEVYEMNKTAHDLIEDTFEAGLWSLHCQFLLELEFYEQYIRISLSLNDLNLLEEPKLMIHLWQQDLRGKKPTLWKFIFENFAKKLDPFSKECVCLNCAKHLNTPSLDWPDLLHLMSSNLTSSQLNNCLQEIHQIIPEQVLSSDPFLSWLKHNSLSLKYSTKKSRSRRFFMR
ncbi:WD40 repeat domain-containing protein pink isoform X2 [Brevipalpus obovatus]